jgi:hypothetical protein
MNGLHDGSRVQARTACAFEANEAVRRWFLAFGRLTRIGEQGLLRPACGRLFRACFKTPERAN